MSSHAAVATTLASLEAAHAIQFFSGDQRLVKSVGAYACAAIESNATCMLIVTREHREGIDRYLRDAGHDPEALAASYAYIPLEPSALLAMFMQNGRPDRERFHRVADELLRQAAARGQPVWAVGEMVGVLALESNVEACLALEELWNEMMRHHPFKLLCAYLSSLQTGALQGKTLAHLCAMHSHAFAIE